jgi:hypothetical protein
VAISGLPFLRIDFGVLDAEAALVAEGGDVGEDGPPDNLL